MGKIVKAGGGGASPIRICICGCGSPIPEGARADKRTATPACRQRVSRETRKRQLRNLKRYKGYRKANGIQ